MRQLQCPSCTRCAYERRQPYGVHRYSLAALDTRHNSLRGQFDRDALYGLFLGGGLFVLHALTVLLDLFDTFLSASQALFDDAYVFK